MTIKELAMQSRQQMKMMQSSDSESGFSDIDSEMKEKLNWDGRGRSKSPQGDDLIGDIDALYQRALEDKKKEEAKKVNRNNFSRTVLSKKSATDNIYSSPKKSMMNKQSTIKGESILQSSSKLNHGQSIKMETQYNFNNLNVQSVTTINMNSETGAD